MREYHRITDTINIAESIEDNYSKQKRPKELLFGYKIEYGAQQMYNRNIFQEIPGAAASYIMTKLH